MKITDEMIEAGCRAMHELQGSENADAPMHSPYQNSWDEPDSVRWKQWDETVRAALTAALSVPDEPVDGADDYYSGEVFKLRKLIAQRDNYIVNKGLWFEFVGTLPTPPTIKETADV